jgi:hypothetical protein
MKKPQIQNPDLLYPELSYKVVGAIYEVWILIKININ